MATDQVNPTAAAAAADDEDWMLLELFAYFEDVKNATTAISETYNDKHIQVTFCLRPPPLLSRLCVHSPDVATFRLNPFVLATEADLALILVELGGFRGLEYYLYQAAGDGSGRPPSLTLLPKIPDGLYFHHKDIGLLRRRRTGEYVVAGFRYMPFDHPGGGFKLCVYDSERPGCWKVYSLTLSHQARQEYRKAYEKKVFLHKNCKVVTIGGDGRGTMAFVDLGRGVLFCDVLRLEHEAARRGPKAMIPLLGYVSLPEDLRRNAKVDNDARLYRDIAFLDGHLKCVDLSTRSLWIRPVTPRFDNGGWSQQYKIEGFRAIEDSSPRTNLLPGHEGVYQPSFRHLLVCQPVVGLRDDGRTLYFTVKTHTEDDHPSVTAVDMVEKKILQVAPFFSRFEIIGFTYVHSRLSKYLKNTVAPGACLCDNNLGLGSSCKMKVEAQDRAA